MQGKLDKLQAPPRDKIRAAAAATIERGEEEAVWIKATGRSIEKALQLALHFQGQEDCKISMKTGSVWAVDDIIETEPENADEGPGNDDKAEDQAAFPDTRLRQISVLEVAVSLR